MTEETLDKLTINYLSEEQYKEAKDNGGINESELYITPETGISPTAITNVIDNLTSESITDALSANQGRVLKGFIDDLATKIIETSGTDLNNYTTEGTYFFSASNTPLNVPSGVVNGWLRVMKGSSSWIKQIWYRAGTANTNDYNTYVRTYTSAGVWSAWKRLVAEDEMYFMTGETLTIDTLYNALGHLTGSSKDIHFTIPLHKSLDKITSININSFDLTIRHSDGGYIVQRATSIDGTVTVYKGNGNHIRVTLAFNNSFNFTNNAPLSVVINEMELSFQ